MRRLFSRSLAASFLTLSLLTTPARGAHPVDPLQMRTDKGIVEGTLTNNDQVRAFKGIPFAAPPVGNLRWQPPQLAAKWKGIRPAKDFGSHCIQSSGYPDMVFHDPGASEDCLVRTASSSLIATWSSSP